MKKITLHIVIIILELIALVHDIMVFGAGMFQYYTINSNILQLLVSLGIVFYLMRKKAVPEFLRVLHLVCAVCLTITFLIAALVLAPQEGFAYYFLSDVAPINHFLGPVLSVLTFLLQGQRMNKKAVAAPMAASLLYGFAALLLNAANILDGPYFFLRVHSVPAGVIIQWFLIISVLCLGLSLIYMRGSETGGRFFRFTK